MRKTILLTVGLAALMAFLAYQVVARKNPGAGAEGSSEGHRSPGERVVMPSSSIGEIVDGRREAQAEARAEPSHGSRTTWGARLVARESGQTLSGVRVLVVLLSPEGANEEVSLVSDERGEIGPIEVVFERHPAAEVRVGPGAASAGLTITVLLQEGQANHDVLELGPPATLMVQVLDLARERPVAGAQVSLYEESRLVGEAMCDSRGFAQLVWSTPGGPFSVRASAPGYSAVTRGELAQPLGEDLELVLLLAATGTLRVQVQDEAGRPISGCRVTANLVEESVGAAPSLPEASVAPEPSEPGREEGGAYVLTPMPCGAQLVVTARTQEGPTGYALAEIEAGTRVGEVTVTVAESVGTDIWTFDERGAPLAEVTISTEEETLGRSDESGHLALRFQDAQRGLELWGFKPGYALAWQTWSPERRELVFRLVPGGSIRGTVVDSAGKPQKHVRVTPLLGGRDEVRDTRRRRGAFVAEKGGARSIGTDSAGAFAVLGLEGTWIDLHVRPPKSPAPAFELRHILVGTQGLVITLPDEENLGKGQGIALLVQVIDSVSRSPLPGVTVTAFYVPNPTAKSYEDSLGGTTDAQGRVRLAYPQEGHYSVQAFADGYTSPPLEVVHYDVGEHDVELALVPAGEIEIRVLDAGGKGREGYWIQARDEGGEPVPFAHFEDGGGSISPEVMTDLRGRVVANKMPSGLLILEVRASRGGPVLTSGEVVVRAGERAQVELRLP